ncbi:MAG: hypothetical protein Q8878_07800 [Bacillota bacterium]|nr:hypothetical protein [Bacillota bacterium]
MPYYNGDDEFEGGLNCIEEAIERNIGRIVIVYTTCGGAAGSGFTGLLASCERDCIKLVTTLPAPPPNPFPACNCGAGANICGVNNYGGGYGDGFGSGNYDGGYNLGYGGGYMGGRGFRRGCCGRRRGYDGMGRCCNPFGSTIRIPICQIVSIVTAEP